MKLNGVYYLKHNIVQTITCTSENFNSKYTPELVREERYRALQACVAATETCIQALHAETDNLDTCIDEIGLDRVIYWIRFEKVKCSCCDTNAWKVSYLL